MAEMRSEYTGKHVALGIFVVLTISFAVMTYYFADQIDRLAQVKAGSEKNAQAAGQTERTARDQYRQLRDFVVGQQGEGDHASLLAKVGKDLDAPPINALPRIAGLRQQAGGEPLKSYPTYHHAVETLHAVLGGAEDRLARLKNDVNFLEYTLNSSREKYTTEVDVFVKFARDKQAELQREVENLQARLAEKERSINDVTNRFGKARDEREDAVNKRAQEGKKLQREIADLGKIIEDTRRDVDRAKQLLFEQPDGEVKAVSGTEVYINLGVYDDLKPGLTFSVFADKLEANPYVLPKASLEVLRLVDSRQSLARVTSIQPGEAVLPGDKLYNPVWSPGAKAAVAYCGEIFIDGDTKLDNDAFAKLVEYNGGTIDASVNVKLRDIAGTITPKTTWLVVGVVPEPGDSKYDSTLARDSEMWLTTMSKMKSMAQEEGVRIIDVRNFLTFMGYDVRQQTVPSGGEEKFIKGDRRQ
ncbi:MAG: hypothetical protein ACRDD1_05650, partial [Planctomycetia bacterium]